MEFHGISIFFPVIVVHFQRHMDDLHSNDMRDLINSTYLVKY